MTEKEYLNLTSTQRIFDYHYECYVPYVHTITLQEHQNKGLRLPSDPSRTQEVLNQKVHCWLTINNMVEYYRQYINISVKRPSDLDWIYRSVTDHIFEWKDTIDDIGGFAKAPIEDLILLDQFASTLFDFVKYEKSRGYQTFMGKLNEYVPTFGFKHMDHPSHHQNMVQQRHMPFENNYHDEVVIRPKDEDELREERLPTRISLADYFKRNSE